MCTVTFIPSGKSVFITSNRDEKNRRSPALPPAVYAFGSGSILFPKDGEAGGTWIAAHENGNAVVFLNGGFEAHRPEPPYRKSRGLILLDLIDHSTPYNCFLAVNLNNIEPFTAVIVDNNHLFECRWDGDRKHHREIDRRQPHIWSSCTLYDPAVIARRKSWFDEWMAKHPAPTQKQVIDFHRFTGDGDTRNDLLMNRDGQLSTISITSLSIMGDLLGMEYLDLALNKSFFERLHPQAATTTKE